MNSRTLWISVAGFFVALTAIGILGLKRFPSAAEPSAGAGGSSATLNVPSPSDARDPSPSLPTTSAAGRVDDLPVAATEANEESTLDQLRKTLVRPGAWENEALLTFRDARSLAEFLALARAAGLEIAGPFGDALTLRARFGSLEELSRLLESMESGALPLVGPNYFVSVPRTAPPTPEEAGGTGTAPFDEFLHKSLGIPDGTDCSNWGDGVIVAVIDSGISEHPTFRDGQVTRIDLVGEDVPMTGHGTAMGSLIAGNAANARGIAPGARLLDIRIAGEDGLSDSYLLAQGVHTAVERGADILNISLGSYGDSPAVARAIDEAQKKGALVVAPVGNEGVELKAWPAAYPGVISVSGVDARNQLAYFSNTGRPTLAAPAVGIISAYYAESQPVIGRGNGTSQAAALVSGALAYLQARGLDPRRALTSNARPVQGSQSDFGAGVLHLPGTVTH